MFDYKHYVPVLKGKRAEFPVIQEYKSRDGITPIFEAVPTLAPDYVPRRMSAVWDDSVPFFIDLLWLDDEELDDDGVHPITECFGAVEDKNLRAIPVTGPERTPGYQNALASLAATKKRGFAIRLTLQDFEDEDELKASIDSLVSLVKVKRKDVDIFIDADTVTDMSTATVRQLHSANLALLPYIQEWRTLTVIAGSFPLSLAPLTREIWNMHPRADWLGWKTLVNGKTKKMPERFPSFGDYMIAHPDLPPTGRATILGQLRYSITNSFMIWKGHNVFTHEDGFGQFNDICADLIPRPEYSGQGFSSGDAEIYEKATNPDDAGSGNAETWRKIGMSHHCEMVLDQIASLP